MEDQEIYSLAHAVLGTLTTELRDGRMYKGCKGNLKIVWDVRPNHIASASSPGEVDQPPQHSVTIHYQFVRQLWRDAEAFCEFIRAIPPGSDTDSLYEYFNQLEDKAKLPQCFTEEEQVKNLFLAALTWVYFHEIGHLMQEHGYIRAKYSGGSIQQSNADVHEFLAEGNAPLTGLAAVVSHTTELAADFEATSLFLFELFRHMDSPDFVEQDKKSEVFSGLLYLMICGLSIVFLRFNGPQPLCRSAVPRGSHPDPMTRLEINISHINDLLSIIRGAGKIGHIFDKSTLVKLSGKAGLSASLYWSMTQSSVKRFDTKFLLHGLLSDVAVLQYMQSIIHCWDQMQGEIQDIRRFGSPLGLMTFSDDFRSRVQDLLVWGAGPESQTKT